MENEKKSNSYRNFSLFCLIFSLIIIIFNVYSLNAIKDKERSLGEYKEELNKKIKILSERKMEYNKLMDYNKIGSIAEEKLKMKVPTQKNEMFRLEETNNE